MPKRELVDLTGKILRETEKAVRFSETGEFKESVWLPKSEIEIFDNGNGTVTVTVPEWLAIEKELV